MIQKRIYQKPKMEISFFENTDVIVTSGDNEARGKSGRELLIDTDQETDWTEAPNAQN